MSDERDDKIKELQDKLAEKDEELKEKDKLIENQGKRITNEGVKRLQVERRQKDMIRPRPNGKHGDETNEGTDFITN